MQRIILDTDLAMSEPGSDIDDGFALALAHAEPGIQLDLITTVSGPLRTLLALELCERLGCTAPVVEGAAAPLARPGASVPLDDGMRERYGHRRPAPGYAAAAIADHVLANPGEITIVAIGPLTNIAMALVLSPQVAGAVKEIVIMGGIFLGQTLTSRVPGEYNIWADPEAADAVLHSGARLRFVGLDVTLGVRLTNEHAALMSTTPGSFGSFAGEATTSFIRTVREQAVWVDARRVLSPNTPSLDESAPMHDPLAVAVVAHPELVTWRPAHVSVVTGDGLARGVIVTDLLASVSAPEPNCVIATAVDADGFMEYFLEKIVGL